MTAKDLAEKIMKYPDYEINFCCSGPCTIDHVYPEEHKFYCIDIDDIDDDKKCIILGGCEY